MTDNQPNRQEARAWAEKVAKSKHPQYTDASRNAAAVILANPVDEYKRGFQDGCAHMKEDYEAGRMLESRAETALAATNAQAEVESMKGLLRSLILATPLDDPRFVEVVVTASEFIRNTRRRNPGQPLSCPKMIALDDAIAALEADT